jgi:hypothetical protein
MGRGAASFLEGELSRVRGCTPTLGNRVGMFMQTSLVEGVGMFMQTSLVEGMPWHASRGLRTDGGVPLEEGCADTCCA